MGNPEKPQPLTDAEPSSLGEKMRLDAIDLQATHAANEAREHLSKIDRDSGKLVWGYVYAAFKGGCAYAERTIDAARQRIAALWDDNESLKVIVEETLMAYERTKSENEERIAALESRIAAVEKLCDGAYSETGTWLRACDVRTLLREGEAKGRNAMSDDPVKPCKWCGKPKKLHAQCTRCLGDLGDPSDGAYRDHEAYIQ